MKKKLTKIILAVLLCAAMVFGLSSCGIIFDWGVKECEHEFSEWTQYKAPTCTDDGESRRTCAKCGEVESEAIAALGHDMTAVSAKAPTCTEGGWEAYEQCSRCEYNTKVALDCLDHAWSDEWTSGETSHWHACTHEGCEAKKDEAEHAWEWKNDESKHWQECTEDGCGAKKDEAEHAWEWKNDESKHWQECTEDGCGAKKDEAEHAWEWKNDESKHWQECTHEDCGVKKDEAEHTWKWKNDESKHWQECTEDGCGAKKDEAEHADGDHDHSCDDCSYKMSEHNYGEVTYKWADDRSACTAHKVCTYCSYELDVESESVTYEDSKFTAKFPEDSGIANATLGTALNIIDATDMSASEFKTELDALLATGTRGFEIKLAADASDDMFAAIRAAFDSDEIDDGSIDLTITGATAIPDKFLGEYLVGSSIYDGIEPSVDKLYRISLPDVTSVGELAFQSCEHLESVYAPRLTTIDDGGFNFCTSLKSIDLSSVTWVGSSGLSYCYALTSLDLPVATAVGEFAFEACRGLQSISFGALTEIPDRMLYSCSSLTEIRLKCVITSAVGIWVTNNDSRENVTLILANGQEAGLDMSKNSFFDREFKEIIISSEE